MHASERRPHRTRRVTRPKEKMAPNVTRQDTKTRNERSLTNLDLQHLHDPEVRFTTLGHRHFAAPNPVHVRRQFINDGSFKKVIDSWFGVLPSEKRSHSCEMRRGTGTNDGRTMGTVTGESGWAAGARALSSDGEGTWVRRRRRSVPDGERRAAFPVGRKRMSVRRSQTVCVSGQSTQTAWSTVVRPHNSRKCRTARKRPSWRICRFVQRSRVNLE